MRSARDGRRCTQRRRAEDEITSAELFAYFLRGLGVLGFICFFAYLLGSFVVFQDCVRHSPGGGGWGCRP
jgi:hypothetical protein